MRDEYGVGSAGEAGENVGAQVLEESQKLLGGYGMFGGKFERIGV